ncbi:MAG TPA: hypothetical protein VK699_14540 [Terriglobales bacterium]|jgi:hypothetical protein|nr:hypothetical protein [Terriglobales bacterium]
MELVALKVVIVVACGLALFYISRSISRGADDHLSAAPSLLEQSRAVSMPPPRLVPRVGSELPFPFDIGQLEADLEKKYGPDFFRPRVLNYYFRNMDLETGPANPTDFYDDFYIELENPANGHRWTASFWVTTPSGLVRQMQENRTDAIWGTGTLVVKRFDLETILRSALENCAEAHAADRVSESEWQEDTSSNDIG